MKLLTLKLDARGVNGWESPVLHFGNRLTSVHAPNGSGKTPVVQSVAYCLGFDTKFRDDIQEKCQAAVLTFEHGGHSYTVTRELTKEFHVTVTTVDSQREFFSERDFSKAIFEEFSLTVPVLVGSNRQATLPYLSTVLPIFYVKQDGGYNEPYRAPALFIQDQFVEMVRFAFGLSPKRSYNAQKDLLSARDHLEGFQRKLVFQQKVVADISASVDDAPAARDRLARVSATLTGQINELRESVDAEGAANEALLDILQAKEESIRATRRLQSELRARVEGIESIRSEIEGEIKTLSLNEESKRVFESFFDICGKPDCGLFVSSSASYAKNLMYLKDQIKDLEANSGRSEAQLSSLETRIQEAEKERTLIASKIKQPDGPSGTAQLVSAVQALTRQLLETEQERVAVDRLTEEKRKYIQFDEERSRVQDRIAMLQNNGRADLEFNKLRATIRELTVKWMDALNTPNASRDVEIDLEFKFKFGNESIEVFTGSTCSRLILAVHAAIFECYLRDAERPFRFLILDTPKQQELNSDDLAKFLNGLQSVCDELNGQFLISATEYRHPIGTPDMEWLPQFPSFKQSMYLGPPSRPTI